MSEEVKKKPTRVFPFWLLVLIITVVILCCWCFVTGLNRGTKKQDFGFRFY